MDALPEAKPISHDIFAKRDVWQCIFSQLQPPDIGALRQVSKFFDTIAYERSRTLTVCFGDNYNLRLMLDPRAKVHKRLATGERQVKCLVLVFVNLDSVRQRLMEYVDINLQTILKLPGLKEVETVEVCNLVELGRKRSKLSDFDIAWRAWIDKALPAVLQACPKLRIIINGTRETAVRDPDFDTSKLQAYLEGSLPGVASLQDLSLKVASGAELPAAITAMTALERLTLITGRSAPNIALLRSLPQLQCLSVDIPLTADQQLPHSLKALRCTSITGVKLDLRLASNIQVLALPYLPKDPSENLMLPPNIQMLAVPLMELWELKALCGIAPQLRVLRIDRMPFPADGSYNFDIEGPLLPELTHLIGDVACRFLKDDQWHRAFPALEICTARYLGDEPLQGPKGVRELQLLADSSDHILDTADYVLDLPGLRHIIMRGRLLLISDKRGRKDPPSGGPQAKQVTHLTLEATYGDRYNIETLMKSFPGVHSLRWQRTSVSALPPNMTLTHVMLDSVKLQPRDVDALTAALTNIKAIACVDCSNLCGADSHLTQHPVPRSGSEPRRCRGARCWGCMAALSGAFPHLPKRSVVWTGAPLVQISFDPFDIFNAPVWPGMDTYTQSMRPWWMVWDDLAARASADNAVQA